VLSEQGEAEEREEEFEGTVSFEADSPLAEIPHDPQAGPLFAHTSEYIPYTGMDSPISKAS
jgi:hypothetical protein